jgi:hypothetical protein
MAKIPLPASITTLLATDVIPLGRQSGSAASTTPTAIVKAARDEVRAICQALLEELSLVDTGGSPDPVVTLPSITATPSSASVQTDVAAGTVLTTLSAVPAGATRTVTPNDGRVVFNGAKTALVRGGTAATAGTTSYTVTDTLAGATNSPRTVSFALTFTAVVVDPPPAAGATITTAQMTGTGAAANTVHSFAQAFQQGHITPSETVVIKLADGTTIPTQMDITGYPWADGSVSHAAVHFSAPGLADGALNNATICKATPGSTTPINMATALSGRTARVEISNGTTVFTYDLVANLPANRWWNGPLAAQARYTVEVPRAAGGGGADLTLQVDLTVYTDASIAADVMVWNRKAWNATQGDTAYTLKIIGDAGLTVTQTITKQPLYTGEPLFARWKANGAQVAQPVWMTPPVSYIAKTGFAANQDTALGIDPALVAGWASEMASADWANYRNAPYYVRGIKKDQGPAGARPDIGETTKVNASWLTTGHKVAQQYAIGQALAYFNAPLYCYDHEHGSWPTPIYRPWSRTTTNDADFVRNSDYFTEGSYEQGWQIDAGHWGDHHSIPYLLTGRRIFLDGVMAAAAYTVMEKNPGGYERGDITHDFSVSDADTPEGQAARRAAVINDGEGVLFARGVQIRTGAWGGRQIYRAGRLAPASQQPHGDYFILVAEADFKRTWSFKPLLDTIQGQLTGMPIQWIYGDNNGVGAPWQVMMRSAMYTQAARLGYANALNVAEWTGNFVARILQNQAGWFGSDATQYNLKFGTHDVMNDPFTDGTYNKTYAALGTTGYMNSYGDNFANVVVDTEVDYQLRACATIAQLYDLLQDNGRDTTQAAAAWAKLQQMPPEKTYTRASDFQREPFFSIVRFGETRAA